MLFYEVVFKRKRVYFGIGYYIVEIAYVFNHFHNLFGLSRIMEVLPNPIFKHPRFSDVNYVFIFVKHNVNAGAFRQQPELFGNNVHNRLNYSTYADFLQYLFTTN